MNISVKKIIAILITIVMCVTLLSLSSSAVSAEQSGNITLSTIDKESKEPISGATFRIYRIASACFKGEEIYFVYTDGFKDCGMEMGNFSDAYLPVHLMVHATVNAIAFEEKTTDISGKVTFRNIQSGAYLIVPVGIKDGYLNPTPFIVTVPVKDETQNKWIYNIDATPKIEADKDDTDEEKTYISVKKIWETYGKIPDSINVSLIKDGTIVESVALSAANNWYHRWDNLEKEHSWNVIETDVPAGYSALYEISQMTVIIRNRYDDSDDETTTNPDDTTLPDDDTTNPTEPTKPDNTTNPTGETESTTKPEELIDTGQLNWPVPVFAGAGMILFSIGWSMLNFSKKDEETE